MKIRKIFIILLHALIGWAGCAAIMGIGMATLPIKTTLILHAIGGPLFFSLVAWCYFSRFNYTSPLQTALVFVGFVIVVDLFGVSLLVYGNLDMFSDSLGTWIPFGLIFTATYLTGLYRIRRKY